MAFTSASCLICGAKSEVTGRMVCNTVRQIVEGLTHLHTFGIGHGGQAPLVPIEACRYLATCLQISPTPTYCSA